MLRRANEISQNLGSRRPKLSVSKVPEELRSVRVKLHIPLMHSDEFIGYMPLNFIWSLNDQHISPHQFVVDLLVLLCIPPHYAVQINRQLAFQLIEYIERHSFEVEDAPLNPPEFNIEKRRPGRPAKSKNGVPPPPAPKRNWSKSNVVCPNCQFANAQAGYECKKCRLPFAVLEQLNLRDPVQIACTQLYELVTQRVGNLSYFSRSKRVLN